MGKGYKVLKTVKGTIVVCLFSAALVSAVKLAHDYNGFKDGVISTLDNAKKNISNFFDDFNNEENSNVPSAKKTKVVEDLGKKVDEILGNETNWDETSKPDTYGEALSGVTQGFLDGHYIAETASEDEIKNEIDEYLLKVYELSNKDLSEAPKDMKESLSRVLKKFLFLDYEDANYKESIYIIKKCTNFVFNGDYFNDKNISFDEMNKDTKLYFIDNILCMDRLINNRYNNYKNDFEEESIYRNLDTRLTMLEEYISSHNENDLEYFEYKDKVYQLTYNN